MSKEELLKNAQELIDNCNCWLEDENGEYTSSEEQEWFQFEKETIQGLLNLIEELLK